MLAHDDERRRVEATLRRLFADNQHGQAIRDDLRAGISALPIWMQEFLRGLLVPRICRGATMTDVPYKQIISGASPRERLDFFLATANRLGVPVGNVVKDFWVCWTLNALYYERPLGPRLLFKGGTSLSKAYGLIQRFSEDIDIAVFGDDLDEPASVEELEVLSNKKRRAKVDATRDACRAYIRGPIRHFLAAQLADATSGAGRIEIDEADSDGQTLLVWYPEFAPRDDAYVRHESNSARSPRSTRTGPSRSAPRQQTRASGCTISRNAGRASQVDRLKRKAHCRSCPVSQNSR